MVSDSGPQSPQVHQTLWPLVELLPTPVQPSYLKLAAIAGYQMAAEPTRFEDGEQELDDALISSDEDAEYEEDPDTATFSAFGQQKKAIKGPQHDLETQYRNSVEKEEDYGEQEGGDDEEDAEGVGAVKIPNGHLNSDSDLVEEEDVESQDSDSDASGKDSSSDAESDAEVEWEEGSEDGEEAGAGNVAPNSCIFCGEDEEHDPSEDFEEYLACAVCGDNSHRQCARTFKSLKPEQDAETWRCPNCVAHALEPDHGDGARSRRRSSAPKITRDLLPAHRGASKPESHSVFNNLIVDDDPLDGTRLLRKRKASSDEEPLPVSSRKRRRKRSDSKSDLGSHDASSIAQSDAVAKAREREDSAPSQEGREGTADYGSSGQSRAQSSRPRRSKRVGKASVTITSATHKSLMMAFQYDPIELANVSKRPGAPPKRKRRPARPRPASQVSHAPRTSMYSVNYATPFYSYHERENDELKSKPYGGILAEAEVDTSQTLPQVTNRERFENARQKAEDEWRQKTALATGLTGETEGRATQKVAGPPSKIKCINFGGHEIDTWYAAPYPEEYSRNRVLHICEFCLKYMNSDYVAWRHKLKCPAKHPPGDEIYREQSVSVFEVDGRKNPVYCQNLCLLAKLFLGSKTLYYDVEPFLFYVMTEHDEYGCHFVGYFSKEKRPSSQNNVSCILTLPTHQRKGYGHLLIDFSYLLTRVEGKTGSPEKPLSDMGLVSYRNYWRLVLSYQLRDQKDNLGISGISERTGMTADDIVAALEALRALVRDPITKTYALRLDKDYYQQCIDGWEAKNYVKLNEDSLVWTPYIMGRNNLAHYDRAPPLGTLAPRDDDDVPKPVPEEGVQIAKNGILESKDGHTDLPNGTSKPDSTGDSTESPILTPSTELDKQLPATPGPPSLTRSPSKQSLLRTPVSTPLSNGHPLSISSTIPPTRFEIFPPLPGTGRRKPGRPFARGGRRTTTPSRRTGSPARRGGKATETPGTGGKFARRTRSKLADVVRNDDEGVEVDGEKKVDVEEEEDEVETPVDAERDNVGDDDVAVESGEDAMEMTPAN
ncbi:MAG: hypothetical protein M1812_004934 [Candelaria pacifica]|nr:MAG: hypothetical protein M1812_004934 [Candelaria pacifica]